MKDMTSNGCGLDAEDKVVLALIRGKKEHVKGAISQT